MKKWFIPILACGLAVCLAVTTFFEEGCKTNPDLLPLEIFLGFFGYAIRPTIIFLFIWESSKSKRIVFTVLALLLANIFVYATAFFVGTPLERVAFYYELEGSRLAWGRGPLGYTSHILSGVLLALLVGINLFKLRGQHRFDAVAILVCAAMIVVSVILETFSVAENLLNTSIAVSTMFYYLHTHSQANKKDALTGLFERKSYYEDIERMERSIKSVIQIDMNSLKELNDNFGHSAGDEALRTIASVLDKCIGRKMYLYRMGGDEFLAIGTSGDEAYIRSCCEKIETEMRKTPYRIAVGYSVRKDGFKSFDQISREAESMMYEKKAEYYHSTGKDRRVR